MIFWYILLGIVILLLYFAIGIFIDEIAFDGLMDEAVYLWPILTVAFLFISLLDWFRDKAHDASKIIRNKVTKNSKEDHYE